MNLMLRIERNSFCHRVAKTKEWERKTEIAAIKNILKHIKSQIIELLILLIQKKPPDDSEGYIL